MKPTDSTSGVLGGAVVLLLIATAATVVAYPGRTAADGCHYCRTNCAKWNVASALRRHHQAAPPLAKMVIAVRQEYDLPIDRREADALDAVLAECE